MRVAIWSDNIEQIFISDEFLPDDVVFEIPESLYQSWRKAVDSLAKVEKQIKDFQRDQDRERFYEIAE